MTASAIRAPRDGAADVVYVLCLLQTAFLLLAGIGEVLLMGFNPAYLVLPVAKVVLLITFAAKAITGRRWALIGLVVLHCATLLGLGIQFWAGFLPWLDHTVNLVGLITNVALPAATVYLCVGLLAARRTGRATLRPPQDPYAPAPLVTSATPAVPR